MSRYLVVSLLLLLGSPSWSWAAISCGSATENDAAGADPWNISYTAGGTGASTVVIGLLSARSSGSPTPDPTGVTQAGNAMTLKLNSSTAPSNANESWIYFIKNPTAGSQTSAVDWNGTPSHATMALITCTGVDTGADPFRGPQSATGTSTAPSLSITSAAGDVVIDVLASAVSGAITVGADQSEVSNQSVGGGNLTHASSQEPGAASVTMSWTLANSVGWTQIAASLKPDASRRPSGIIYFP